MGWALVRGKRRMIKQEIFTKTSRIYLDIENKIKEMYEFSDKNDYKLTDLYKSFDILVQVLLLYISISNDNVSNDELEFIDKLTIEEDILDEYNYQFDKNLTWDNLNEIFMDSKSFEAFINDTYDLFYFKLSKLIMFLASVDSYTNKDYYSIIRAELKEMLELFILIDDNKDNNIDLVLDKVILNKYLSLKNMFKLVIEKNKEKN